ncbi:MAG: hypothetical protein ACK4JE_02030 [Endomicrobiia bacterium]
MSENVIKSALEIALEKAKNIKVSDKELERIKYIEEGKKIAGQYLVKEKYNINSVLKSYKEVSKKYILESIESVFLSNIVLPKTKTAKKEIRKALEGMVSIKENKQLALQICGEIDQLLDNYRKYVEENYRHLKKEFQAQFEDTRKAVENQLGIKVKVEVESNPEFQRQWREIISQIDSQYTSVLEEYKQRLKSIR